MSTAAGPAPETTPGAERRAEGQPRIPAPPSPSPAEPTIAPARAGRPALRLAVGGQDLVMGAGLVALGLLIVLPLASVVVQAVFPRLFARHASLAPDAATLVRVLRTPAYFHMLADSMVLSLGAAVVACLIGASLAVLIGRTDIGGRGAWTALIWCNLLLPSFLTAEGWTVFLQRQGLLSQVVAEPLWLQNVFSSPWGVGAILALKFYPFAFLTVSAALPWLGGEHEAVARTLGAGRVTVWRRINLPLLTPFLLSGAAIVFADVLSDFGVAITVAESHHFPLLTYGIYSALYDLPTDFGAAGALSLLLTLAVAGALAAQALILRGNRFMTIHSGFRPAARMALGRARLPAAVLVGLFFLFSLGFPAGSVLAESFLKTLGFAMAPKGATLGNYTYLFTTGLGLRAAGALGYSLRLAATVATAAVLLGTTMAYLGTQGAGRIGQFLQGVSLWTISVPGIILAAGYIFLWNQPWLVPLHLALYGTVWALALCYLATELPYVLRFQLGAFGQFDRRLLAAGRVLGAGVGRIVGRIVLPLVADGALSLWLFVLAGTAFELPASEFLYPPGHPTLAVEVNHFFNESLYGRGTALAVMAAAILIALVLALRALLRRALGGPGRGRTAGPDPVLPPRF